MAIQERPRGAKKKPGKFQKSAPTVGKAAPTALKGKTGPPKRMLIFGSSVGVLIILVLLIFFCSPRKETTPETPLQAAARSSSPGSATGRPAASSPGLINAANTKDLPSIRSILLQPLQPTRMNTLKAEVGTAFPDSSNVTCAYEWKVNDQIVAGATGETLNLSTFKRGDLVTVTVTPYAGDKTGHPVRSRSVVIHSITPSLDLKSARQAIKAGEPMDLQLVSLHPDSDDVTFSLEAPMVPGMSIDSHSGKITWIIPPNQKGMILFGAAVEDPDKTKVKKTFEITLE
jgi:hypothetical protein